MILIPFILAALSHFIMPMDDCGSLNPTALQLEGSTFINLTTVSGISRTLHLNANGLEGHGSPFIQER